MKKILLFFTMIVLVTLIGGCGNESTDDPNSDDNNNNETIIPEYYVHYDGRYYAINKTVAFIQDQYTGYTQFNIFLAPSTVSYNTYMESLIGTGSGMRMSLWLAENTTSIPAGVFTTPESPYIEINDLTNCAFLNNTDTWDEYSNEGAITISTGTLTIVKNEAVYTIDFEGADESGEILTAHFQGSIQTYQESFK